MDQNIDLDTINSIIFEKLVDAQLVIKSELENAKRSLKHTRLLYKRKKPVVQTVPTSESYSVQPANITNLLVRIEKLEKQLGLRK